MRALGPIMLCLALAAGAQAQRRGGATGGMGGFGGGMGGVGRSPAFGGSRGAAFGGFQGSRGFGTFRGGFVGSRGSNSLFRGGFHDGYGTRFGLLGSYYIPSYSWGLGLGYFPGYAGFGLGNDYGYYPYSYYPYDYSPNVTVVYPSAPAQQTVTPIYVERAHPVLKNYDQYGQQRQPVAAGRENASHENGSPIYLFAFADHSIQAASAYWVDGRTLHYINMQREEKQAPVDSLDREFTLRLNEERRVTVQIPE